MTKRNTVMLIGTFTLCGFFVMLTAYLYLSGVITLPRPVVIVDDPTIPDDRPIVIPDEEEPYFDIDIVYDDDIDEVFFNKLFPFDTIDLVLFNSNNTNIFFITQNTNDDINRVIVNTSLNWMKQRGFIDLVTTFEGTTPLIERAVGKEAFNNVILLTHNNKLVYFEIIATYDKNSFRVLESFFDNVVEFLKP